MRFLLLCLFVALAVQLQAQAYVPGQALVGLRQPAAAALNKAAKEAGLDLRIGQCIAPALQVWLCHFDPQRLSHAEALAWLQAQPEVWAAQNNHYLENRSRLPNDTRFGQQWQYLNTGTGGGTADADIDADSAWAITTGGLSPLGDTIVICILDDGLDLSHTDLNPNRWYNRQEIPNNGLDDDNNGYVDDYQGWNAYEANDDLSDNGQGGFHGTPVAGIVGAKGNNSQGVTGVNWDVKLMIVVGGGNEAQALAAYNYPLTMRRLYNQSNGQRGAFIVASNASWGVNNLLSSQAPLWCALYDSLGQAGILNIASTTNNNTNVDLLGDMPTHCPSDYLIAVTNTNNRDLKPAAAGYGQISIDLGAPGEATYTITAGNNYGTFGGTSAAAPHVAGVVGLLYAAPCPRLSLLARVNPSAAALLAREAILNGVDPLASLSGLVATGGRLNAHKALLQLLQQPCTLNGCYEPFFVEARQVQDTQAQLSWLAVGEARRYRYRYQVMGDTAWLSGQTTDTSLLLTNLSPCTQYQFQLASDCDTALSNYSGIFIFETANCCRPPRQVQVSATAQGLVLQSQVEANVQQVQWEWRPVGQSQWDSLVAGDTVQLLGLQACTEYEWRAISICATNPNNRYTRSQVIRTLGCGYCEDQTFCLGGANDGSFEWIERVEMSGAQGSSLDNRSGTNGGYAFFADSSLVLETGRYYPFTLSLGTVSTSSVQWKIWLDFNKDGYFQDTTELVYQSPSSVQSISDSFYLSSALAAEGSTRMRIGAKYGVVGARACEQFNYGEAEDYCVRLRVLTGVEAVAQADFSMYPNPTQGQFMLSLPRPALRLRVYDAQGRLWQEADLRRVGETLRLDWSALPKGLYAVQVIWQEGRSSSAMLRME